MNEYVLPILTLVASVLSLVTAVMVYRKTMR